jgi:hypothetical protein
VALTARTAGRPSHPYPEPALRADPTDGGGDLHRGDVPAAGHVGAGIAGREPPGCRISLLTRRSMSAFPLCGRRRSACLVPGEALRTWPRAGDARALGGWSATMRLEPLRWSGQGWSCDPSARRHRGSRVLLSGIRWRGAVSYPVLGCWDQDTRLRWTITTSARRRCCQAVISAQSPCRSDTGQYSYRGFASDRRGEWSRSS